MPETIKAGTILIKEGALLPEALRLESESCVPGWRLIKDLDGYGLDREIQKAGWTFFCQAAEIKEAVFGIDRQKMVRRAIERILKSPKAEKFNSLEITRVASVSLERFPGIWYATVSAHPRHIHESLVLFCETDLPKFRDGGESWGRGKIPQMWYRS
jgi:hypothetical protein